MDRIADMMNVPTRNVAEFGFINAKPLSSPNEPFALVDYFVDQQERIAVRQQRTYLVVVEQRKDAERYSTYFMKIDNVKFRQKVVPGDTLIFHVSFMTPMRRRTGEYGAVAPYAGTLEDGDIASDACALAYLDILVDGDKGIDYHA